MIEEHLKQIKSEVDEIDKRIGWNSLYQTIRMESSSHDFPCAAAKSSQNKLLNRYRDVSPYDHSRVVLSKCHPDYINASLVQVSRAGRRYILTQGPLPQTACHFWLMIWEQNSSAILMLNKVIEKNQIKCHQYWPLGAIHGSIDLMEFPEVDLRVRYVSEEQSRNFVVRTLRVEDMTTSEAREVLQFHYTTWPDFGVPSTPRSFLHFLQVVRDSGVLNANVGPPVVHCSAGIGRSGTFCLVDSCLLMMEEGRKVNIKEVLMDMRKFRMGLIQTPDQLRFSYLAILEGLQQLADGKKRFMSDENENGQVDIIDVDERPPPPRRTDSLSNSCSMSSLPPSMQDELYRRLIAAAQVVERPLPDIPTSSSSSSSGDEPGEESVEDSLLDEDEDVEEDGSLETNSLEQSSKEESLGNLAAQESQNSQNCTGPSKFPEAAEITNISDVKTNGITSSASAAPTAHASTAGSSEETEASLRRRAKQDALREKIKEIKAHQKEAEAVQGFYRSPQAKRRKQSNDDGEMEDGNDDDANEAEEDYSVGLVVDVGDNEEDNQPTDLSSGKQDDE